MDAQGIYHIIWLILTWTNSLHFARAGYYYQNSGTYTWDQAKDACALNGQQLTKVESLTKFNDVKAFLNTQGSITKDIWIGVRLNAAALPAYQYVFVDGSVVNFFAWDTSISEPNNQVSDECIKMESTKDFKYRTNHCVTSLIHYLCEDITIETTTESVTTTESTTQKPTTEAITTTEATSIETTTEHGTSQESTTIETTTEDVTTEGVTTEGVTTEEITTLITTIYTPGETTTGISTSSALCDCPCDAAQSTTMSTIQLQSEIQEMKNKLQVNKTSLSSYIRAKTSAPDHRTSSKIIGSAGTAIISLFLAVLVLPDLFTAIVNILDIIRCKKRDQE